MVDDPFGWVGTVLDGKVRVDEAVGEGGFGVVYRGTHLGLDEPVAIKILRLPSGISLDERARFQHSFIEEGRLLYRLSRATSNIVQAHDAGFAESPKGDWCPYLVLEWLEGVALDVDLSARRKRGQPPRSIHDAVALLTPAAEAIAVAHEMHVSHRDIKPANLFLAEVGERRTLKVLDFGIAKVMTEHEAISKALQATSGTGTTFTPMYGAPELFSRSYGATGPWTDVFSLALVLFEVAAGKPALDDTSLTSVFESATNRVKRPALDSHGIDVPAPVQAVITRALAVDPRERYLSARVFWDALQDALRPQVHVVAPTVVDPVDAPGRAKSASGGTWEVTYDRGPPGPVAGSSSPTPAASSRRGWVLFVAGGAAVVVVILLAVAATLAVTMWVK